MAEGAADAPSSADAAPATVSAGAGVAPAGGAGGAEGAAAGGPENPTAGIAIWVAARGTGGLAEAPASAERRPSPSRRATANSPQAAKRSAGTLASARLMTVSTVAGRSGRRWLSDGGGSDSFAHTTASPSPRRNGGAPDSNSKAAHASA